MEPKVEQWMNEAATEIYSKAYYVAALPQTLIAKCIAAHSPHPSPDICEKCGQEVVDGHFSLVCHKPSCLAALSIEPWEPETMES